MIRLAAALFGVVASTLAGTAVVIALVAGATGLWTLLGAALVGAVAAVPVSYGAARALHGGDE